MADVYAGIAKDNAGNVWAFWCDDQDCIPACAVKVLGPFTLSFEEAARQAGDMHFCPGVGYRLAVCVDVEGCEFGYEEGAFLSNWAAQAIAV